MVIDKARLPLPEGVRLDHEANTVTIIIECADEDLARDWFHALAAEIKQGRVEIGFEVEEEGP